MTTQTLTLTAFLEARIAETEAAARAAQGRNSGRWQRDGMSIVDPHAVGEDVVDWVYGDAWDHIARHDPARVLAECEAKRAIVSEREPYENTAHNADGDERTGFMCSADYDDFPCATLRALASVYADHPDYCKEWR